jgi:hypothetical protein
MVREVRTIISLCTVGYCRVSIEISTGQDCDGQCLRRETQSQYVDNVSCVDSIVHHQWVHCVSYATKALSPIQVTILAESPIHTILCFQDVSETSVYYGKEVH